MNEHADRIPEVTPAEVAAALRERPAEILLVDCRSAKETRKAAIAGALHVPRADLAARLAELDAAEEERRLVVYCHHGISSLSYVQLLREAGLENVASMAGGIDRWSREIDPSVPRY